MSLKNSFLIVGVVRDINITSLGVEETSGSKGLRPKVIRQNGRKGLADEAEILAENVLLS